jgi:hypothetical protein
MTEKFGDALEKPIGIYYERSFLPSGRERGGIFAGV